MRLLLCSAVLATAIFGVYGFPADLSEPEVPRRGGGNPNAKPTIGSGEEKPRPSLVSKPANSESEQSPTSSFIHSMDMAHSSVSSELPSPSAAASEPAYDPILETSNSQHNPEAVVQDAIPEIEVPVVQVVEAAAVPSKDVLPSVSHPIFAVAPELASALLAANHNFDTVAQAITTDGDKQFENARTKIVNSGKSRRHAGVEHQSALRIGDFDDVEADAGSFRRALKVIPEYPSTKEQNDQELSKEEMILMAMDQMHQDLPQISQSFSKRPNGYVNNSPINLGSGSLLSKPKLQSQFDNEHTRDEDDESEEENTDDDDNEDNENNGTVELRNGEPPATIVQEQPVVPKHPSKEPSSSDSHTPSYGSSSKNKPRPYGMDKPGKNRPTLDSGMKDKNEHFGLHQTSSGDSFVQKGEPTAPTTDSGSITYLGFQIPNISWTSFTDLFPSFWGRKQLKMHEGMSPDMGKSDQTEEDCVEDEIPDAVRSPVIQGSSLCAASGTPNNCHLACQSSGFSSGSCLGPYPTPGCLCRMPKSDHLGVVLQPLAEKSSPVSVAVDNQEQQQELETTSSGPCKKCACIDACKQSGSFTGFCVDRCYCALPWSKHVDVNFQSVQE